MTALVLTDKIAQTSAKTVDFTTITTSYGDGYEQRATDGINFRKERWNLLFDNLETTDRNTLWSFIDTVQQQGVIEWTAPGDSVEKKWVIDPGTQISEQVKSGQIYSISMQLKRVYDL